MSYDHWKTTDPADAQPPGRLPCGCYDVCDPYAHDTAWDWDGTPDGPDVDDAYGSYISKQAKAYRAAHKVTEMRAVLSATEAEFAADPWLFDDEERLAEAWKLFWREIFPPRQ